jgi:hypothetical protein
MTRIYPSDKTALYELSDADRLVLDGCRECPDADVYTPYEKAPDPASRWHLLCTYECDSGHVWTRVFRTA